MKRSYEAISTMNLTNGTSEPRKVLAGEDFIIEENKAPKSNVIANDDWKTKIDEFSVVAGTDKVAKVLEDELIVGNKMVSVEIDVTGTMPAGTTIVATLKNASGVALNDKTLTLGEVTDTVLKSVFKFKKPLNSNLIGITVNLQKDETTPYVVDVKTYDEEDTDLDKYLPSDERPGYLPVNLGNNAIL